MVWTRPALDSLLDVVRYIKRDNPPAAQRFAATIRMKVTRLELSLSRVVWCRSSHQEGYAKYWWTTIESFIEL